MNIDSIANELKGSVFFPQREKHSASPLPQSPEPQMEPETKTTFTTPVPQQEQQHDTVKPRYHDTTVSRNHDTMTPHSEDALLEVVRKAVKQIGKEAATQRLTLEEKQALDDIEYSYKRQGIKTSGNEIMRIATNYIVHDYQQNGENSIVAKVLKKLNS